MDELGTEPTDWKTIAASVAGVAGVGLAGVTAAYFKGLRSWVERRWAKKTSRRTYGEHMANLSAFSEELESLRKIDRVSQVIVFRGHNCGGLPTPGRPYTVHAIQGWQRTDPAKPALSDPGRRYRRGLQVDAHFTRMLEDVIREGVSIQVTEKIAPDAKLKGYFELDGIAVAVIYYLGLHDDELLFLSVSSSTEDFAVREKLEINDRVSVMKQLVGTCEDD